MLVGDELGWTNAALLLSGLVGLRGGTLARVLPFLNSQQRMREEYKKTGQNLRLTD